MVTRRWGHSIKSHHDRRIDPGNSGLQAEWFNNYITAAATIGHYYNVPRKTAQL